MIIHISDSFSDIINLYYLVISVFYTVGGWLYLLSLSIYDPLGCVKGRRTREQLRLMYNRYHYEQLASLETARILSFIFWPFLFFATICRIIFLALVNILTNFTSSPFSLIDGIKKKMMGHKCINENCNNPTPFENTMCYWCSYHKK